MSTTMDAFEQDMRDLEHHAPSHLQLSIDAHNEKPYLQLYFPPQHRAPLLAPPGSLWSQHSCSLMTTPPPRIGLCRCPLEFGPRVGRGAFGIVVKARSIRTNQAYAVKIVKKRTAVNRRQIHDIDREARLLMNMKSPFVCKAFDAFQDIENIYIVMDFLSGGDLATLIERYPRFSETATRFYAAELVSAISYIHLIGITHHDIKPANILIARDGHIKLSDFGLARVFDFSPYSAGTTPYMAPEQFKHNAQVTQSVDWYALGVVMYNMLTGEDPYTGDTEMWDSVTQQGPIDIQWPTTHSFNYLAVNLVTNLLWANPDMRLGSRGGWDVMSHPWFDDLEWERVRRLEMRPPFIPRLRDKHDTRMFPSACAVNLHAAREQFDQYYHLFPVFRRAGCCASSIPNAQPY